MDWEFVFTDEHVVVVCRSNCNGGIFSSCEVWEIPYGEAREAQKRWLSEEERLEGPLLRAALDFYEEEVKAATRS
jgi:hypothetical protein